MLTKQGFATLPKPLTAAYKGPLFERSPIFLSI